MYEKLSINRRIPRRCAKECWRQLSLNNNAFCWLMTRYDDDHAFWGASSWPKRYCHDATIFNRSINRYSGGIYQRKEWRKISFCLLFIEELTKTRPTRGLPYITCIKRAMLDPQWAWPASSRVISGPWKFAHGRSCSCLYMLCNPC